MFHLGLTVWRVEKRSLVPLPEVDVGFFHQKNCYIVLKTDTHDSSYLHLWHGSASNKLDRDHSRKSLQDLDKSLEGAAFLSIEHEGYETPTFLNHFEDGLIVIEGKHKQQLSNTCMYTKRLYIVSGSKYPKAICSDCVKSAVSLDRILILDGYPRMYVWMGTNTDYVSRIKAIRLAKKIRRWQRDGRGHIVVIDATDDQMSESFLAKLTADFTKESSESTDDGEIDCETLRLYRVNGERVLYDMPLVASKPLQQKYLTSTDSYLLDTGPSSPVCIWVGNDADTDTLYGAIHRAQIFMQYHNYSSTLAVCRLLEGDETNTFKTFFSGWRNRSVKERQLTRSYTAANIGRALYSRTDKRTVAKLAEVWSDDEFVTGDGENQLWRVEGEFAVPLDTTELGVFSNTACYLILHRPDRGPGRVRGDRILYYWIGDKCSEDEEQLAQKSACALDTTLGHTCSIIRALDGKEPKHFFNVLRGSMIILNADKQDNEEASLSSVTKDLNDDVAMFCIREIDSECMRVEQIPCLSSYLNSSAAFIVISKDNLFLWYGKNAKGNEREYAKNMLAYFCPERSHNYSIVSEGKESALFWMLIENNGEYPKAFEGKRLQRRISILTKCDKVLEAWRFQDVPNFLQEDLSESSVFLLDSHDQIMVWCGSSARDKDFHTLARVLKDYLDRDPCGRGREDVSIWIVNQNYEPQIFTRHFGSWDVDGYGGQLAYEAARKRLRQENAMIDIHCLMVDTSYIDAVKVPYKNLVSGKDLPEDIDETHKEFHLTDTEFNHVLRQSRAEFYRLPQWKKCQILRSARLVSDNDSNHNHSSISGGHTDPRTSSTTCGGSST